MLSVYNSFKDISRPVMEGGKQSQKNKLFKINNFRMDSC